MDGHVYLVHAWAGSRSKMNSIVVVCEMNAEGTRVISNPVLVYDGNDGVNHTVEGPKFYKRNGYYYIFAPAGGVATGWQLVLRSRSVYGPYAPKIVMAQGKTDINGPHQGAWIDTNTGESWFVHFQDKAMYGRVIHLNPMTWVNDWPVIGVDKDGDGCGEPVTIYRKPDVGGTYSIETPVESDEFNTRRLGLQWEWHANYQDMFGFTSDLGFVRIYGHVLSENFVNFWEVPNLLLQKFPAEKFTATAKLKVSAKMDGQQSGLIVMGWDYSYIGVEKVGERFILKQAVCKDAEQNTPETAVRLAEIPASRVYEAGLYPNCEREIYLRVKVEKGGICRFSYSLDGKKYMSAGTPFTARQGKWIGAKVGLFSGTIEENIRFGCSEATDEEIRHAADIAQAADFIMDKPKGFKERIVEGAGNLSGGQKQRLSIARALVRKPDIYIYDDSFSALDMKTDAVLRQALKPEVKNAIVIIVAQRVSTIMDADQILVLDEGRLAASGRHEELLKTCPLYYEIAASQLSEEELQNVC